MIVVHPVDQILEELIELLSAVTYKMVESIQF